jgi:non-ribosomal peptide synthetase component F
LNKRANQLARTLRKRGAGPGQRVGIFVERSIEMMIGLLSIQKSGAAYVPLDPAYPAERIRLTLEDAQVSVLLTQNSLRSRLPEHSAQVLCMDDDNDAASIATEGVTNLGKTAVAERINGALPGAIWIPYAVEIDGQIIRVFDSHCHYPADPDEVPTEYDHRWILIRRPLVVVGGGGWSAAAAANLRT